MDEYFEILADHIFDQDKLVTYKWLSKELQIHVNVAKQILWEFYKKYHENGNIECTYLLIGTLKNNGMCVEVVRESALSTAREKYSMIISEHLYSVHKPLEDLELLASSGSGDVTYSAIKCDVCIKRNDEEMHFLRWGTSKKENTIYLKSVEPLNQPKIDKKSAACDRKNGFNNLFNIVGKQKNPKMSEIMEMKEGKDIEETTFFLKDINSEKDKGFVEKNINFVEKKSVLESIDTVEKDKSSAEKNRDFKENCGTKKVSPNIEKMMKTKKENSENFSDETKFIETKMSKRKEDKVKKESFKGKKTKEKDETHGNKRKRSQENGNVAKRRKRIVIQNDSSDSDMQSDIEMEETVENMEKSARSRSPSPTKIKHENGKRKILKLVNKVYKEGEYMVTKKEYVYISCSEDEEKEEERKKEPPKMVIKTEKIKKKQTILTNFFKKS